MLIRLFRRCAQLGRAVTRALQHRLAVATQPAEQGVMIGALADLVRGRPALVAENALLRQQLLILRRSAKRPRCTPTDRALLVLLAGRIRAWQQALLIVQPDTLLRWHRDLFRRHWRQKSRAVQQARRTKVPAETIALIRELAAANRLWGAERIRGELLKVGIRVAKTTVQRHMRGTRPPHRAGQSWATFLRNHAAEAWACDFLPVTDLLFRPRHAFFVIAHGSRRVVHVGVTHHPTDAWVAQQLREATPFGERPRYSSAIAIASMAQPSPAARRRAASRRCGPRTAPPGKTPPASGSSAASGGSAWTTSWCWGRPTCGACSGSTWPTSTRIGRIKGSGSTPLATRRHPRRMREVWATCGPSRCSVASTTHIGGPRSADGQTKRPGQPSR
jgi:hypothetical protein